MSRDTTVESGDLDLQILEALTRGPQHGWGILRRIREFQADLLRSGEGRLYPALYRLESRGLIRGDWVRDGAARHARRYRILRAGLRRLGERSSALGRLGIPSGAPAPSPEQA